MRRSKQFYNACFREIRGPDTPPPLSLRDCLERLTGPDLAGELVRQHCSRSLRGVIKPRLTRMPRQSLAYNKRVCTVVLLMKR